MDGLRARRNLEPSLRYRPSVGCCSPHEHPPSSASFPGAPLSPPPPPVCGYVSGSLTPLPCPMQPWGVKRNSGILATLLPPVSRPPLHHLVAPVVQRAVCLSDLPTPFVGFSSQSDGAGCYGNCICLQDPQIAEPINPFPSHPKPPPPPETLHRLAVSNPRDLTSSPWVSLPSPVWASPH